MDQFDFVIIGAGPGGEAAAYEARLRGATVVRAIGVRAGAGKDGADVLDLDDGSTAEGHAILLAVGRDFPVDDLGLEHYGIAADGGRGYPRDGRLLLAEGLYLIGDPAGPEMHTHQAHYQGPDASAAIHECVLAIRARVPVEVLADTIHAFPSTSRIFNGLFNDAARKLAAPQA